MSQSFWYILAALIFVWTGICAGRWWKQKKKGGCGSCGSCPYSSSCHSKDKK